MVSKPFHGPTPIGFSAFGRLPAPPSQRSTAVAPFQLAAIVVRVPRRPALITGRPVGRPLHGKRKAREDCWLVDGKWASKSSLPPGENSERLGRLPQPTNASPLGST